MSFDIGPEPGLLDEVIKYGLYLGAIFQLVCIAAVIFVPLNAGKSDCNKVSVSVQLIFSLVFPLSGCYYRTLKHDAN
jgi:hypothetical protein